MERNKIILIGIAAAVLLVGAVILLGLRKPKGPDCNLIAKARTLPGRPVVALAPLLGDDSKGVQAEIVMKAMSGLVDVARVPTPTPDFTKASVPEAVKKAETISQDWLNCGAAAVVWGTAEHEGDQVIEEKKGRNKKPITKPVYGVLLWVTTGPDSTIQISRTSDGREAGETAFRVWGEKELSRMPEPVQGEGAQSRGTASAPPGQEAPPPADSAPPSSQEKTLPPQ